MVIIGIHCFLDSVKMFYTELDRKNAFLYSLKENRVDFLFTVICIALVFVCRFSVGVAGLRFLRGIKTAKTARLVKGTKTIKGAKTIKGTRTIKGMKTVKSTKTAKLTETTKGTKTIKGMKTAKSTKTAKLTETAEKAKITDEIKFKESKIEKYVIKKILFETGQKTFNILIKSPQKGIGWFKSLSLGDKLSIIALTISLYFILINPLLQGFTVGKILQTIWEELRPTIEIQVPW
jgi:hypothetical protein